MIWPGEANKYFYFSYLHVRRAYGFEFIPFPYPSLDPGVTSQTYRLSAEKIIDTRKTLVVIRLVLIDICNDK